MSRIRSRARSGDHVHEPEQVLVGVAEAHPAADPRLEHRRRARQVERDHALVGVPDVDHPVDVLIAGVDLERVRAVSASRRGARRRLAPPRRLEPFADHRADARLVERLGAGRVELAISAGSRRSRARTRPPVVSPGASSRRTCASRSAASRGRSNRGRPALDGAGGPSRGTAPGMRRARCRSRPAARSTRSTRSGCGARGTRSVVDHAVVDLDLADRVVALEVRRVVVGVPEAELDRADQREAGGRRSLVGHARAPDLVRPRRAGRSTASRLGSPRAATRSSCTPGRAGTSSRPGRAAPAASWGSSTRRSRRRAGRDSGRPCRGERCCSGSA